MRERRESMSDKRHVCTAEDPWGPEKEGGAVHPDAKYVGEEDGWPSGDLDVYLCPNCGLRFKVEVPQ